MASLWGVWGALCPCVTLLAGLFYPVAGGDVADAAWCMLLRCMLLIDVWTAGAVVELP